jgi:twitching motility two-component system response regulator PilH
MATILIADDTAAEAALMATVVQRLGHIAQTVGDGEACLATAKTLKPDLILLDVVMPKMDGFNTCRKIKKDPELANTPVIMVTSKNQASDKFWAERQGANRFITKPFTPDDLAAAIKAFVN